METITAKEIGAKFVVFVTDVFMTPEGCSRPGVDEELIRLEDSGELVQARKDRQIAVDTLISEILSCKPGSRSALFSQTDPTTLALVYDRVQCGTHTVIEMREKGVVMPRKGMPPLPTFFRKLLLQKFS